MRIPASTYRLQITPDFDLTAAAEQLERLQALGADWVYLSPVLRSVGGSDHGYDVADPTEVDPARGGREAFDRFCRSAHELDLGVLVDIVPNHQGVASPPENPWWWSLLRDGRGSEHAQAFDVDWESFGDRVMIPVLGDDADEDGTPRPGRADQALEQLEVELRDGQPVLTYFDNVYPVAEGTAMFDDDGRATEPARMIHERQNYQLVNWRRGDAALNYRRFFTIATLAGIRVEDRQVFEDSHVEVRRWIDEGLVDGLRIDHPDGVRDPAQYLGWLAELTDGRYTLIEKILEPGELLPREWLEQGLTAGTTGYDALGVIDRLLVDPDGEYPLTALDGSLRAGSSAEQAQEGDWERMIHGTKRAVTDGSLHAEVERLAREASVEPALEGVSHETLVDALSEVLSCFGVYRTYLPWGSEHLAEALEASQGSRPELAEVLTALGPVLGLGVEDESELTPAARRFQQTSGMVMAKGVEDSAFYRYSRLTSLTEVGGDPSSFSLSAQEAHDEFARRHRDEPLAMTTLSTHDTKRSESVRARISVLAEIGEEWAVALASVERDAQARGVGPLADRTLVNLVLQAMVGAWPISRERAVDYALKAARESGTATAWVDGDEAFEADLSGLIDLVLEDPAVRGTVEGIVRRVQAPGWSNALSQKLIQLTVPGVPDVYQGSEQWAPALVDPDNRRPVDHAEIAQRLAALDERRDDPSVAREHSVPAVDETGDAKLLVTSRALRLRRDRPELFSDYAPLQAEGEQAEHLFAFDRGCALTLATRLPVGLEAAGGWGETSLVLPDGQWKDALTGGSFSGTVRVGEVLDLLPVALLVRD